MQTYRVSVPQFDGPLDLLLQVIERNKLDITQVSLALVADQFLEHLRSAEQMDTDELAEFVVIGARLLLIKSRALLPREAASPDADDAAAVDLTRRLRAYEAFRQASEYLRGQEESGERSYPRVSPPFAEVVPTRRLGPGETTLPMLQVAYQQALIKRPAPSAHGEVVREIWSVKSAVRWLCGALANGGQVFQSVVAGFRRPRLVASFLALLETSRLGLVRTTQSGTFADIEVELVASEEQIVAGLRSIEEGLALSRRSDEEQERSDLRATARSRPEAI